MTGLTLAEGALNGFFLGGLYAIAALGLSMVFRVARFINLAHGELLVLGAYAGFILSNLLGISLVPSVLTGAAFLFLIGYFMQKWLLNPVMDHGTDSILLTVFSIFIIAHGLYMIVWENKGKIINNAYSQIYVELAGLDVPMINIISFILSIVLIGGIHLFMVNTFLGKAIRAVAQDRKTALARGININSVHAFACAIGTATAALGGMLIGMTFTFSPSDGLPWLLKGFIVVILGGIGNIFRILAGGLILGTAEGVGAAVVGAGYRDLIGLILLLVILAFKPSRLFGRSGRNGEVL